MPGMPFREISELSNFFANGTYSATYWPIRSLYDPDMRAGDVVLGGIHIHTIRGLYPGLSGELRRVFSSNCGRSQESPRPHTPLDTGD